MFLLLLMNALFALTFPLGKLAMQYTNALFITGVRMTLAGVILMLYTLLMNKGMVMVKRSDWWLFAKTTIFYVYLAFVPEFWALAYMPSLKANLLWSFAPFISAILGYILLKERLSTPKIVALIIGMLSMIPIFMVDAAGYNEGAQLFAVSLPEMMLLIAITSTSYAWFLMKQLLARGYSLEHINGITMLSGGLLCLVTAIVWPGKTEALYSDGWVVFGYALALVIVSNILAYKIYGMSLKRYTVTFLNFTGFLCPIFGAFFAKIIFNEPLYVNYLIGFAGIMVALFLFYRDESQQVSPV